MFDLFGRRKLPPLVPPLCDYSLSVCVELAAPLSVGESSERPVVGYFLRLGVRSTPDRLRSFVESAITDGAVQWNDSTYEEARPDAWDASFRKRFTPVEGEGIWYRSGRIFFPPDGSETH
jgi:hypothetical protein